MLRSTALLGSVVLALGIVACAADPEGRVRPSGSSGSSARATDADEDALETSVKGEDQDAPAPGEDAAPKPNVIDAEGEPDTSELATDPGQNADCRGPFNCILPNPAPSDRNRIVNPRTGTDQWPIAPNTPIFDGAGGSRGTVTSTSIKINFGQRKSIGGVAHVYAFAVQTTNGGASSWVPEAAIQDPLSMPTVEARNPGKGDYEQVFTITGGDPSRYGDLKVVPNSQSSNEAASDYLTRPGDVVNMLWALPRSGGVSNDTWPAKKSVVFKRARGVASVYVYLHPKGEATVSGTQRFLYGHVEGRYGWIARDALDPPAASPGPSQTFCCAKCAGRTRTHRVPFAHDCTISAKAYCAAETSRGAFETAAIESCGE